MSAASPSPAGAPPPPGPIAYNVADLEAVDYFGYTPSMALAATALALYLVAAAAIGAQTFRARPAARYMNLVTATAVIEAAGYAALAWLINHNGAANLYGAYVALQVCVILSPNLLQAANYVTVGRVSAGAGLGRAHRFLRPRPLTVTFVAADLAALLVQAVGISIWASEKGSGTPDTAAVAMGYWITVAGLAFQLASFLLFTALAVWVQRHRANAARRSRTQRALFLGVYVTNALVSLRNVFRFVEFLQGAILEWPPPPGTYVIADQEVLFYTLDTLPILLCFPVYWALSPTHLLPRLEAEAEGACVPAEGADEGSSPRKAASEGAEGGGEGGAAQGRPPSEGAEGGGEGGAAQGPAAV